MGDADTADLLPGLNPVQREAVTAPPDVPLLVVAGAGSGKTRVLTHRVAWLITERDTSPFAVLAITFTNKAAGEMKERVGTLVGPVAQRMWVSTFHSACARILRREAGKLGLRSSFSIYDQSDSVRLVDYVRRDLNLDPKRFPPRRLASQISALKNELVSAEQAADQAVGPAERRLADVYREYQRRLLEASAADFDDLLLLAVRLFREHPDALERWRKRFRHVLVDEFQDTNGAQWELVRLLTEEHRSVMVVGDQDQSVYKFRGADYRNLIRFEEAFPEATVIVLEQNYRSTPRTPSSSTTPPGGPSTCGPSRSGASSSPGTSPRTSTTRPRTSPTRSPVSPTPRATASPTSPSFTGPTPRAASSRRRSCGPGTRTASSAACASTTGAR
jgi:DNA helicase-2/ATP-dependent DNA helicase PcrA